MIKILEEKLKINKWHWIPIFGTIAYAMKYELFVNMNYGGSKLRKIIRKPRSIWNTIFSIIPLSFSIAGFILKYKFDQGPFPWPFIVALCIGIPSTFSVKIPELLYKKGLNNFKALTEEKQNELILEAEIKKQEMDQAKAEFKQMFHKNNKENQK